MTLGKYYQFLLMTKEHPAIFGRIWFPSRMPIKPPGRLRIRTSVPMELMPATMVESTAQPDGWFGFEINAGTTRHR